MTASRAPRGLRASTLTHDLPVQGPNNHMLVSANTEIRWRADTPAKSVYVTGSFVDWQELVPMQQTPEGEFVVRCCLPVRLDPPTWQSTN